jgi:hypothetical protein
MKPPAVDPWPVTIWSDMDPQQPGRLKQDGPSTTGEKMTTTTDPSFTAAPGFKATAEGIAKLEEAKAYAKRHGLTVPEALTRMEDPTMREMDEVRHYAKEKGITMAEAFVALGYR